MTRHGWIETEEGGATGVAVAAATLAMKLPVTRQCALAGISRATVYAHRKPKVIDQSDLQLSGLIDREYTLHPFYGSRRMVVYLGREGPASIASGCSA